MPDSMPALLHADVTFEVEFIMQERVQAGRKQYLIRWKGCEP
jgi:hypothetical protein